MLEEAAGKFRPRIVGRQFDYVFGGGINQAVMFTSDTFLAQVSRISVRLARGQGRRLP